MAVPAFTSFPSYLVMACALAQTAIDAGYHLVCYAPSLSEASPGPTVAKFEARAGEMDPLVCLRITSHSSAACRRRRISY
ncbi:hypothetical protein F5Y13DRAFT_53080 [Hypoxylon sp. FL1857]|nr:hypothetical protein F5Y13DRAFT_53080 [Hypoxylon sp. FL1857]